MQRDSLLNEEGQILNANSDSDVLTREYGVQIKHTDLLKHLLKKILFLEMLRFGQMKMKAFYIMQI